MQKLSIKIILGVFILSTLNMPSLRAHGISSSFSLPLNLSVKNDPILLKGIILDPRDSFKFDFVLDRGTASAKDKKIKKESLKLIRYFLSALTIPEGDIWVNLSPRERNRIVPQSLSSTEMGRDLLREDYFLKQLSSLFLHPQGRLGREFWNRLYSQGNVNDIEKLLREDLNKIWIVPDRAEVFEQGQRGAFVVKSRLKVMLQSNPIQSNPIPILF